MNKDELKKKVLIGIMGHMDTMNSKKLGNSPKNSMMETEPNADDAQGQDDLKSTAEQIYNIMSEHNPIKTVVIDKIVKVLEGLEQGE